MVGIVHMFSLQKFYIMGAHLLCKNYVDSFVLKLIILNQVPIVHVNGFVAHQ